MVSNIKFKIINVDILLIIRGNEMSEHVCPVWMGYFLANPLRKLVQNPRTILKSYINDGMKILDIGSAMGFFSIPMARMAGKTGKVVCIDLQKKMLENLEKKAIKNNLIDRIELRNCSADSLLINDLDGEIDFALAFAVLHEVNSLPVLFKEVYQSLKSGGKFLIAEPKGHVDEKGFQSTLSIAVESGFKILKHPPISGSLTALIVK